MGSRMLTNSEIKYIIKAIKFLENRGILLKEITEKTNSQKERILTNFLVPLIRVGLPLMKNILMPLAKVF